MPGSDSDLAVTNNDLATQLANLLRNIPHTQNQNTKQSDNLSINLKLNSQNYALWARMIRVAIGGKSKNLLNHLTTDPPAKTDDKYEQWEQNDLIVFSWLIQNIEPALASNLTEFPTTKSLWDALVVTYSSGKDKLQTFDLHVKANEIKQNGVPLEDFWIMLQGIWGEIDRRDPNPMTCAVDIATYNKIQSEKKLFQFLNAIDRQYDSIKREILRWDPLPSVESAYAAVRKETAHQNIIGTVPNDVQSQQGVGAGLLSKGQRRPLPKGDKSHLKCTHCDMSGHTKEQCFRIVGFPDWWSDNHKTKNPNQEGKVATAIGNNNATSNDNAEKGGGGEASEGNLWTWH